MRLDPDNHGLTGLFWRRTKARVVLAILYIYARIRRRTVVINAEKVGRLGNRIYSASHILAFAQRGNFIALLPALQEYTHYFAGSDRDLFCRYPPGRMPILSYFAILRNRYYSLLQNAAQFVEHKRPFTSFKTIRLGFDQEMNLADREVLSAIRSYKVVFICGWMFHDFPSVNHYAHEIREYFYSLPRDEVKIAEPIRQLRSKVDVIVGMVVRHGDYRNTRHFYPFEEYVDLMRHIKTLFPKEQVGFFIASDEEQNTSCIRDVVHYFRPFHPLENLFTLSRCDYLVSVPSTFAGSASFLGDVPIAFLKSMDSRIALSDFAPCNLAAPFEGRIFQMAGCDPQCVGVRFQEI
jgi:hypothetical protein